MEEGAPYIENGQSFQNQADEEQYEMDLTPYEEDDDATLH